MSNVEVRRPTDTEFDAIVELQNRYLGSLSAQFSTETFRQVDAGLALIVGVDQGRVVAFLCSWKIEDCREQPVVAAMLAAPQINDYVEGACIAGPVCIDESQRGKGLLKLLYEELAHAVGKAGYGRMLIFVDETNTSSIRAHEKIGFTTIAEFSRGGNQYVAMSKSV